MLLICLFGSDGSGKSTLARLLRSYLYSQGIYAHISWFRGTHFFASLLARLLSRFAAFRGYGNPYYGVSIPSRLRPLWSLIEFFSLLPYYLLRRFLSLFCYVIGDRGVLDFIVWIVVTLDYPGFLRSFLGRFLVRLAVKDLCVYVTADSTVLLRRVPSTPYWFLLKELSCYNVLAKYYAKYVINTSGKKPRETFDELLKYVKTLNIF